MIARPAALAAAVMLAFALPAHADRSEEIFRHALDYTVQVRAAVPAPFEPDVKGTVRGAGFVVDAARGWVLTNAHVVARSPSRVEVARHGQDFHEARKLYVDPHLDVALVELPPAARTGLAAASLHCGASPSVGHPVGAFGHPWNLKFTGTRGIISGSTTRAVGEALQTDAPINGGNSGGPLISLESGRVVGINTAQIRGSQNTNFAVAMHYACRIVELLQAGADPSPPSLGVVYFREMDNERVLKVARNYVPSRTGLQAGDVIRGVVGVPGTIETETQLQHALRGRLDGFDLRVERGGAEVVVHGRAPATPLVAASRGVIAGGVLFGQNPLVDAAELRIAGLMVHHVEKGSDGEAKELARGDFLEAVDGRPVSTLEELAAVLERVRGSDKGVALTLKRYGGSDRAFVYVERRLIAERVDWVGGDIPAAVARHAPKDAVPVAAEGAGNLHKSTDAAMGRTHVER